MKDHFYSLTVKWTGNTGTGTSGYTEYQRSHTISAEGKTPLLASSDPAFRGDKTKYNPEELLVASLSSCHMLWFLHLCADNGVVVLDYVDAATGIMTEVTNGDAKFREVTLNPKVTVKDQDSLLKLNDLHKKAHSLCFISKSVNFPVKHNPTGICAG